MADDVRPVPTDAPVTNTLVATAPRITVGAALKRFHPGWLALLAAIIIALYLCWVIVRPLADVLLWATVLVIVFYPFHQALLRRSGRPTTSALLSCGLVVGVIVIPLTLLTVVIVKEAGDATEYLSNNWSTLTDPESRYMKRVTA